MIFLSYVIHCCINIHIQINPVLWLTCVVVIGTQLPVEKAKGNKEKCFMTLISCKYLQLVVDEVSGWSNDGMI
jgi:hypothetical protein